VPGKRAAARGRPREPAPQHRTRAAAQISQAAHRNGTTLRDEAIRSGCVTGDEFDAIVRGRG